MADDERVIRLLVTGGGTGGHLFPAIAAAEAMTRRFPKTQVLFVGTGRRIDSSSLARYGFMSKTIHCQGLKGKGVLARLKALLLLPVSLGEALWHILCFRPHLVFGVGGYVTGPVVAAARMVGCPAIIHEQNSIPGLANRKLGALTTRICLSLPGSEAYFPVGKTVLTGNPVRQQILELASSQGTNSEGCVRLLILGGSLGAHRVNELVVEALTQHRELFPATIEVIHQTGPADEEMVRSAYNRAGLKAEVAAFFADMAGVYSRSDLLISRAGATTLAEIAVLGKPALLIPYPYAADAHQDRNGRYYEQSGGARVLVEKELSGEKLASELAALVADPGRRQSMAAAMRSMGQPDAAERIVDNCLEVMGMRKVS